MKVIADLEVAKALLFQILNDDKETFTHYTVTDAKRRIYDACEAMADAGVPDEILTQLSYSIERLEGHRDRKRTTGNVRFIQSCVAQAEGRIDMLLTILKLGLGDG